MKFLSALCLMGALLAALAPATSVRAADAPAAAGHYIDPAALDLQSILPAPPAAGSLAALADLEAVRALQAARTSADAAWARRIAKFNEFDFADVVGPWFTAKNLPATAELLDAVAEDSEATSERIKVIFARPRPPLVDPQLQPCVKVPDSGSYPSGHSMRAFVWAGVLAELFPDRREALQAWAHRAAWSRIIGGVHFPTDDVGGQMLARALLREFEKSPAFRAALERAQAEVAPYLLRKAA